MFALAPKMFDFFGLAQLTKADKTLLLRAFYNDLELRVGLTISHELTQREIEEFEEIMDYLQKHEVAPEDDPSLAWLEHVRPDYREVVHSCLVVLLARVLDDSDRIAEIAGIERGRVSSDPVTEAFETMQLESRRLRELRRREAG